MFDLKLNLEPGNADGHTVLRFLVEEKQMPLSVAIERVYKAVAKYAQEYRADQGKLVGTIAITGILGAGIVFPVGVPTVMLLVSAGATVARWMELGAMRERLKPEYYTLKQSPLLEQFVKWLAKELKERHQQELESGDFQTDAITITNVLTAYEDTVFAVSNGEHLDNNASDPILALFVAKLRQHTNHLPDWVIQAFRQLEHAEIQRSKDLQQVHQYMWGDLGQTPTLLAAPSSKPVGENMDAVEVPAVPSVPETEDEQRLGKPVENLMEPAPTEKPVEPTASGLTFNQSFESAQPIPVDIAHSMAKVPKSTIIAASPRVGKGVLVMVAIANLKQLHPDLEIWLLDPKNEPTELHYWTLVDADKRCHFDLRPYDASIKAATELFNEFITQFNSSLSPRKLLIIDEFVMLNQKCTRGFTDKLKDFIVGICSSGETTPDQGIGSFIWVITQSPYVTDIGFKTKAALTTFQRVFLLNLSSIQLYSLAASASFVPSGQDKEVAALLEITGRVFYYSRSHSWHPVPKYQLPSSPASMHVKGASGTDQVANQKEWVDGKELTDDLTWNQMILGMSEEEVNKLIEQRRSKSSSSQGKALPQSQFQQKLLEIIKAATKYPISFDAIRKSRKWKEAPDRLTLINELNELSGEWIRGNEITGYYLQS